MTIRKGETWGTVGQLPDDAPVVSTDRTLATLFTVVERDDGFGLIGPAQIGLIRDATAGGSVNLARTVSARSSAEQVRGPDRPMLPIDLAIVTLDVDVQFVMAASLVVRRRWWAATTQAVMNASFLGDWNVAPSGHPNDGRLDVIVANLGLADRLKARNRLASGTHLPHPDISVRRLKQTNIEPDERSIVWIDGHRYGHAERVDVMVIPDATTIVI